MKNNELEKYITELPSELQEKARQCKDVDELNKLIAENDVELSDDALEAVAGGCSTYYSTGHPVEQYKCLECGQTLYYWDVTSQGNRFSCKNPSCIACQEGWLLNNKGERVK